MSSIQRIFLLYAPLRSGHHAFVDWMLSSRNLNVLHINNTDESKSWLRTRYLARRPEYRIRSRNGPLPIEMDAGKQDVIAIMKDRAIDTLLLNFEDKTLLHIANSPLLSSLAQDFPESTVTSISFSRDPLNLLASRIVRSSLIEKSRLGYKQASEVQSSSHGQRDLAKLIQIMKASTREYCNQSMASHVYVDYYSWLVSQAARELVEQSLGIESITPSRHATIHGGGSSFGKVEAIDPIDQFKRYEQLADIDVFKQVVIRMKRIAIRYYDKISEYVDSSSCRDYLVNLDAESMHSLP